MTLRPVSVRSCKTTLLLAAILSIPASSAHAEEGDGLYGRWDEDLVLSLGAGGAVALGDDGDPARGALAGSASLRFYGAAGPLVAGAWAPASPHHVFVGAELRPLFPGLFLLDMSTGRAFVDLLVQSLSFELGAVFLVDGERSVGLGFGVAIEVPLLRPDAFAQGLWMRLGARRIAARSSFQSVGAEGLSHTVLLATLVISAGINTGMESAEPPRYR